MNWDAIGALGELLSAIAVLATLIYLAIQVRAARKATLADMHQRTSAVRQSRHDSVAYSHPEFHKMWVKFIFKGMEVDYVTAYRALEREEKFFIYQHISGHMVALENAFVQYSQGNYHDFDFDGYCRDVSMWVALWKEMNLHFPSKEFAKFIDELHLT